MLVCLIFSAVLGLPCCAGFSFGAASGLYSVVALHGILTAALLLLQSSGVQSTLASVVAVCGFGSCSSWAQKHRLNSCGTQA